MKIKYNFKDGRSYTEELPKDEAVISELFKFIVRGKVNNSTITFNNAQLKYDDVKSVELVFE